MIKVEQIEMIRRAYFIEGKSIREISRQHGHCRRTVRKAIQDSGPWEYKLEKDRPQPVIGPNEMRIDELLAESKQQHRKQRYAAHRIYELICAEGY
jgi:transposase-like protein